MRSTRSDRIKFYLQEKAFQIMYRRYEIYYAILFSLYYYFPIYLAFLLVTKRLKNFEEYKNELRKYYKLIGDSITEKAYNSNRKRLTEELEEKRKQL